MEFEGLYRAERSALVRAVSAHPNDQDAVDAVQTAFARLLQATGPIENPKAWLYKVAVNEYLRSPRIASSRRRVTETPVCPERLPDGPARASTAEAAELREEHQFVLAALAALPEKQRQVMATHFDGFSHKQIADLLDMEPAAVRQNLRRARKALQKRLSISQRDNS